MSFSGYKGRRVTRRLAVTVISIAVVVASSVVAIGEIGAADPSMADTTNGTVRGDAGADVRRFRGIPYAQPPVGDKRWRLPEPAGSWTGVRDATEAGPRCSQTGDDGGPAPDSSEDCLYLNVTAPRGSGGARPVVVWLHGGGFASGAGSDTDAARMAETGNVVVVTVNFRLGVFGSFGHRDLRDGGTYSLADQQEALRWVRSNADAFGADPGNITLMGESSGGAGVCAQLTSPGAEGLFQRAIIQSGSCSQRWETGVMAPGNPSVRYWREREEFERTGADVAAQLDCGGEHQVECLRKASVKELLRFNGDFSGAAYDTPLLPTEPSRALWDGDFHQVPVLVGNTRDEHRFFAAGFEYEEPITAEGYRALLTESFGQARAGRIAEEYPVDAFDTPGLAWARVGTDASWVCPTLSDTRQLSQHVPTFSFEFADPKAPRYLEIFDAIFPPGYDSGAFHSSEVASLFDMEDSYGKLDAEQRKLAEIMLRYWTGFAADGDPNVVDLPEWKQFGRAGTSRSLAPGAGGATDVDVAEEHHCGFWGDVSDVP